MILYRTFEHGFAAFWESVTTPAGDLARSRLSLTIVAIVVPLNVVFGLVTALALARGNFRGKGLLQAVVDLPFAVSPVIVGVALILFWGNDGWLGGALPGDLLAARHGAGDDVRHAAVRGARGRAGAARDRHRAGGGRGDARRLASGRRSGAITLPAIRVGVAYGVVLTVARSLGEFGALTVVAGGVPGESQTLTLLVHSRYIDDHNAFGAYSAVDRADGPRGPDPDPDDRPAEEATHDHRDRM